MDARASYEAGRERHATVLHALDRRSRWIAGARLLLAAAAAGFLFAIVWRRPAGWAWIALVADALLFLGLVVLHARIDDRMQRASAAARFNERGLARLDFAWDRLSVASERFRAPEHPFVNDLDVFGRASLMQLVDAAETLFGEERLARWLSATEPRSWPAEMTARQQAVRDLCGRLAFREELAVASGLSAGERPDPTPVFRWAEGASEMSTALRSAGWSLPAVTFVAIAIGLFTDASGGQLTLIAVVATAIGLAVSTQVSRKLDAVAARESAAIRWRPMVAAIERQTFSAPLLESLRAGLAAGGTRASRELAALERIIGFINARQNELFRFVIGPLFMWDVHCALALERWRARNGARLRGWLEALGDVEALSALSALAYEHPDFTWAEPSEEPVFEGRGLGHPLIPAARRVPNDVHLPAAGRALVVTGSNMSGKSTLLRAVGLNAALAFAGGPVCARSLRIGPARIATSMRVEDSLEQGVSHFYAEVRRLKRVIDMAHEPPPAAPVLFLLDEILHGTNSRERVLGACAVVRDLLAHGALGAVSTHDLGITALGQELAGKVENVHFEEQVADGAMTFDYVLRPGIVQSSNALRLMRSLGIDVVDPGTTSFSVTPRPR